MLLEGASGIGLATVKAFLAKGAKVILADINVESGEAAAKELQGDGTELAFVEFDATQEESVAHLVLETVKLFGRIDIMVNNVGVRALSETHQLSYEDYRKVIAVNQDGVFFGSKHAIHQMLKTRGGAIRQHGFYIRDRGRSECFCVFLCENDFVTGTTLMVDGRYTAQ